MPSYKSKRKFHKSGEKVSPKEKKTKSVRDHFETMAEKTIDKPSVSSGQKKTDSIGITSDQWDKLMSKIDNIKEQTEDIKSIKTSIEGLKTNFGSLQKKCTDLESSLTYHAEKCEKIEKKVDILDNSCKQIEHLKNELKALEVENTTFKEQVIRQEAYSRRDNLLFYGIQESGNLETEDELRQFFTSTLGLQQKESRDIMIARCHRIGKRQATNQPRPIIARFVLDKEKDKIWKRKSLLKTTPYIILEDFPMEVINRRKLMYPLFQEAKKRDKYAKLVVDKVTFNRKTYSYQQAHELAQILQFYHKGVRRNNGILAFHGRTSIYSNFFPAEIKDEGQKYNCSEQLYQHKLCIYHGEMQAARSVMLQSDPVEMKKISRKVEVRNPERTKQWFQYQARGVMKRALTLKFTQNDALQMELKKNNEQFVEANQHDRIWGVGLPLSNDKVFNPNVWTGTNWLGELLNKVKNEISKK